MEVILLEDVANVGVLGEMVKVKNGYARNYLIPYKKALMANEINRAHFEANRAEFEEKMKENREKAMTLQERVDGKEFSIKAPANEDGKLFGSVGAKEISELLEENAYQVSAKQVILSDGALRQIGTYEVLIQIFQETDAKITLNIVAE